MSDSESRAGKAIAEDVKCNHITLKYRHMATIMACTHGAVTDRGVMIPCLAENLEKSGDVYDAFIATSDKVGDLKPEQIPVFMSTLTRRLNLSKMFKMSNQKNRRRTI